MMTTCPNCGGSIIGDGHSTVQHCENARYNDYHDREPDSTTVLCQQLRILILEDDPNRVKKFTQALIDHEVSVTDSSKVCIELLKTKKFDVLMLDHDLGGEVYVKSGENTGYEVACFLEENPDKQPTQIFIHSLNGVGAQKMNAAIPKARHVPFLWEQIEEYI